MQKDAVNGVLLVDKPAGVSSFGVIAQVRKILGMKKVGHCGTLDNFATGVLIILLGKATRLARFVSAQDKSYTATILFGKQTDTADITGNVIATSGLPDGVIEDLEERVLAIDSQVPPIYSAIKVNGKRAYALAREGNLPQMKSRKIKISDFAVENFDGQRLKYTAKVSKGTYIRTLSEDISRLMSVVGTTEELRRVECAGFSIDECVRINPQMKRQDLLFSILPADVLLPELPSIELDQALFLKFACGNAWKQEREENGFTKIYHQGVLVGVAWVEDGEVKPKIVF